MSIRRFPSRGGHGMVRRGNWGNAPGPRSIGKTAEPNPNMLPHIESGSIAVSNGRFPLAACVTRSALAWLGTTGKSPGIRSGSSAGSGSSRLSKRSTTTQTAAGWFNRFSSTNPSPSVSSTTGGRANCPARMEASLSMRASSTMRSPSSISICGSPEGRL